MNIGKAIKIIRKQMKVSQQELSDRTGISQTSLSKIETGARPSEENLDKISEALKTPKSVLYILAIEENDVPEDKQEKFQLLFPAIKSLAMQIVNLREDE
jgi:transcriptional regulator with XRE-family HTH domain